MQIETSDNSKREDFHQSLKIEQDNISCKDGFCSLPRQNKNSGIKKNKVNLFDPI